MAFRVNYTALDRLIHRVAFGAPSIQITAADIEKAAFGRTYHNVEAAQPIFITSLPRAGTTVMLEALHRFPSLASHVYRDMPFVMAPVLWSRLGRIFAKGAELRERAHRDGMQVGYDSPEAFEEVLWHAFWPEKYGERRIALWDVTDEKDEASLFFVEHMKKIIALRRPNRIRDGRYISKNNANIARLGLIGRMFPGAKILVPLRHPLEHAASLLRQHENFMELHRAEPFVRRYMADLGHYEFGDLHRPIAFPGLDALIADWNPLTIDYWLGYWIAAFEHVLEHRDSVVMVSYEAICTHGRRALADICRQLEIPDEGMLDRIAALFRAPERRPNNQAGVAPELRERAEKIYREMIAGCVNSHS